MVILFELIHLWSLTRQNLDLTETRVFLRIYHLSAFISELCRPRSYYWFLLECNRKGFDLKTGLCYKWRTLRFFFFYQNDWIYTDFTIIFFHSVSNNTSFLLSICMLRSEIVRVLLLSMLETCPNVPSCACVRWNAEIFRLYDLISWQ